MRRLAPLLAVLSAAAPALAAQDDVLAGRVRGVDGGAVAGATIDILVVGAAATSPQARRFALAQRAHLARARMPRTLSDRDGDWRMMLSPTQRTLSVGVGAQLALRVAADGHHTWQRAIGTSFEGADGTAARLIARGDHPRLRLRLRSSRAGAPPLRGLARIERSWRPRADARPLLLADAVAIDERGEVVFDEPTLVPGEVAAAEPSLRPLGYRVTIWATGCELDRRMLPEGDHVVVLTSDEWPPRRVLAARAEPAAVPIEATWDIEGRSVRLTFAEPEVPLLGGVLPEQVSSPSGPVLIDAWDPDAPLFVERRAAEAGSEPTRDLSGESAPTVALELVATLADGAAAAGAVAWLEDGAAAAMLPAGEPWAVADPEGRIRFRGVPPGTHRVLVRHGEQERTAVVDTTVASEPLAVRLAPVDRAEPTATAVAAPVALGSLRLDVGAAGDDPDARVVVFLRTADGALVRRTLPGGCRHVLAEGLVCGPATVAVRVGDEPPLRYTGLLITDRGEALAVDDVPIALLRLRPRGEAAGPPGPGDEPCVSLQEATPRRGRPLSSALFTLAREGDELELRLRLGGEAAALRLHGAAGATGDFVAPVPVPGAGDAPLPLEVELRPPPAEGGGDGKDGED